ncbi:MAG TPA: glycosyltransferase family 2 protein [bacterium]|nr:glycosyltransferase family 2 protein [bacterium]HQO33537.1 glycosyltransferase family 2 protein [bacterium]HQP99629.1 glycosyltransferase family 2 protein [bacterium]
MRFWKRKSREDESPDEGEILDGEEPLDEEGIEELSPEEEAEAAEEAEPEEPLPELETSWREIAVLIPCFNTGKAVYDVITETSEYAGTILCVNDGSTDDTADWIRRSCAELIGWPRNRGKGHALTAGFRAMWEKPGWKVLITMDGDGQHVPGDIPYLVEAHEQTGADIVIGARDFTLPGIPFLRRLSNRRSSKWIGKKTNLPLSDFQSGYRLFSRQAVRLLAPRMAGGLFELETSMLILADRLGLQITESPITTIYDRESSRKSSWHAIRDSRRIYRAVKQTVKECEHLLPESE